MSSIDRFNEIAGHLSEIAKTDNYKNAAAEERSRPLSNLAAIVCDEIQAGLPVPYYEHAQQFLNIEGFTERFAQALVKRHREALADRSALADAVEKDGGEKGAEAARILRAMNAVASPVPQPGLDFRFNGQAFGVDIKSVSMPGWTVERAPDGGAKGVLRFEELDAGWEDSRARLAKARADLAELKVAEMKADNPIDDLVRDAIAELGSNPDTDAITHLLSVDGFQVEVKVERVEEEDAGPAYDTVSQNDIRVGDIVEYHWDGKVRRWEVLDVREHLHPGMGPERARLKLIGEHNSSEVSVEFPLLDDPFILRPRS